MFLEPGGNLEGNVVIGDDDGTICVCNETQTRVNWEIV